MTSTPAPSIETRTITSYIVIALTLTAVAVMSWRIADVFVVAFGGIVFATVLRAMSRPLAEKTGMAERWSLTIVVFGLLIVGVLSGLLFGNLAAGQITELKQRLPLAIDNFTSWLNQSDWGGMLLESLENSVATSGTLSGFGLAAGAVLTLIADAVLLVFLGVYFAADPEVYREGALRLLPPARRRQVRTAVNDAGAALQRWLIAQLVAMLGVGILTAAILQIIGVPLAIALGVLAGILEFVPVLGPIFSAIPALLLAFAHGPQMMVYTLAAYVLVQQVESNLITPLVQRWAVRLPPVVGLLAVLACGYLFGIVGLIFATPIAVVVIALVKHLYVEDTLENGTPAAAKRSRK